MKTTHISAKPRKRDYWLDLFRHRELLYILSKRDVSVRYKQTAIGAAWSLLKPLMTLTVTVFAFGRIAKLPSETGTPYVLMAFSGILIWMFFSQTFSTISNSIVGGGNLVSKVYVPRLIISLSSFLANVLDFAIGFSVFLLICWYYQFSMGWQIALVPLLVVYAYLASLAFGLFFAAVNVRFRDIGLIIPFIVQFGFFASPVAYSSNTAIKGEWWYPIYNLNPLVGMIDAFRWALLGGRAPFIWESFVPSIIIIAICLVISVTYFRKVEDTFVDYL